MMQSRPAPVSAQLVAEHPRPLRAADALVDGLVKANVEVIFGIPGGTISPLYDALMDHPEIRVVHTRHESGAMFAAAAYARTTGKLGVVAVTSGPGILNATTGLASAYCDGLPVLLLGGEVPTKLFGRGALQEGSPYHLNIIGVLKKLTKHAQEVPRAEMIPGALAYAISCAQSGSPGPVALTLPLDVTMSELPSAEIHLEEKQQYILPTETLERCYDFIQSNTVILAGSGLRRGAAPATLIRFAEHFQLPVITTPKGKGVFPESHPLSFGVFGMGGHLSSRKLLKERAGSVLALGTSLGDLATEGWSPLLDPPGGLMHVDINARQFGRAYHAKVSIASAADQFMIAMLQTFRPRPALRLPRWERHFTLGPGTTKNCVAPHDAVRAIQTMMPSDTIYTIDSGEHFLFASHFLEIDHPDSFIAMTGLGSMGSSIGAAIGAKLAQPDRAVAVIIGDGGFAMLGGEFGVAVQENLPLAVFIFNDERLTMCELGHRNVYGRTPPMMIKGLSPQAFAKGLGADSMGVSRYEDFEEVAARLANLSGPLIVDVRIDPAVRIPKQDRIGAMGEQRSRKI